jgi:4-amino-4-deoxy-L-arabinose transferase-like glycosyltransferase
LLDLLAAGWVTLAGLGVGLWLLERWMPVQQPLEQLVLGTGVGLGLLGLLGLGLGAAGLFQPLAAYGIMLALSLVGSPRLWRLFRQWQRQPAATPHPLAAIYLAAMALLALAVALLPPTDWDGLFYHLTGPRLYVQTGGIIGDVNVPHFSFPSLMEMLFTWVMVVRGDIAAKLLHGVFGLLLTGLVYLTAQRFLGQKSAWPAVVILTSMPMLGTLAGWAYNDLALAFYQLASLYAVGNWRVEIGDSINHQDASGEEVVNNKSKIENRKSPGLPARAGKIENWNWLVLSGIFAGLAMGLKYTSFVTSLVAGAIILWFTFQSLRTTSSAPRFTHSVLPFILFSLVALLVASPWYLKNWLLTGNPVYPFLYGIFGGQYWDSFRADWYAAAGTGIGWRPGTLLTLPWLLTLGIHDANYWDGRTGPLLLLFLPLIVWFGFRERSPDRPRALSLLLIYGLAHFCFWSLGVIWSQALWQSRLLLPGLAGLAPVAGWAWANLPRFDLPQFSLSRFVNIVIGITLALTAIDVGLLTLKINPIPYLVGLEGRDDYLTRRLGAHYAAMQQINEALPSEAKVIFLWEPRSYYCRRTCLPDSILDRFPHLTWRYGSAGAIARAWREANVTHVLIHRTGLNFIHGDMPGTIDMSILEELEADYLQSVFDVAGAYQLYSLKAEPYKP